MTQQAIGAPYDIVRVSSALTDVEYAAVSAVSADLAGAVLVADTSRWQAR